MLLLFLCWSFCHKYSCSCLSVSAAILFTLVFTLVVLLFFLLFSHGAIVFLSLFYSSYKVLLHISHGEHCYSFHVMVLLFLHGATIVVLLTLMFCSSTFWPNILLFFFVGIVAFLTLALLFLSMVLVWYFPSFHYKEFANKQLNQ